MSTAAAPYAPLRWRAERFWELGQSFFRRGWIEKNGRPSSNVTAALKDEFTSWCDTSTKRFMNACAHAALDSGLPLEQWLRANVELLTRQANALRAEAYERSEWALLAAYYERGGRQIFDLSEALVEELVHTDVEGATLEQLDLPFDSFFVRFGPQQHLRRQRTRILDVQSDEFVDGAFVIRMPGLVRVGLSLVQADGTGVGISRPIDIPEDCWSRPCLQAIDAGVEMQANRISGIPTNSDESNLVTEAMRQSLIEGRDLLIAAMPLVLNSLFYIESLEKTFGRSPGRDAPPERHEHWARANEEQKRKLASKLEREGYAVVYMVGSEVSAAHEHASERGLLAPHWRRGHWRMQRHGPGRTLIKRIRIKPILVNADASSDDAVKGHVYRVGSA